MVPAEIDASNGYPNDCAPAQLRERVPDTKIRPLPTSTSSIKTEKVQISGHTRRAFSIVGAFPHELPKFSFIVSLPGTTGLVGRGIGRHQPDTRSSRSIPAQCYSVIR